MLLCNDYINGDRRMESVVEDLIKTLDSHYLPAFQQKIIIQLLHDRLTPALNKISMEVTFDCQIQTLRYYNCNNDIIKKFLSQKKDVLAISKSKIHNRGNCLFLPIIPGNCLDIEKQLSMIEIDRNHGYSHIKAYNMAVEKRDSLHNEPYYIFNVDDGEMVQGEYEKIIKYFHKVGRRPLYTAEIISLCLHESFLLKYQACYGLIALKSLTELGTQTYLGRGSVPILRPLLDDEKNRIIKNFAASCDK